MVYVFPHRGEEFLKLGFSRDPLQRMQNLHRRYFDFFDIERVILIETARVVEARRIELQLKRAISEHRAPSPLDVRTDAGGETEWFRGAYALLREHAAALEREAFVIQWDARTWIKTQLIHRRELIFEWASAQFRTLEIAGETSPYGARIADTLRDALDANAYFGIDIANVVPSDVAQWYRNGAV
jgi:hypothetical protein